VDGGLLVEVAADAAIDVPAVPGVDGAVRSDEGRWSSGVMTATTKLRTPATVPMTVARTPVSQPRHPRFFGPPGEPPCTVGVVVPPVGGSELIVCHPGDSRRARSAKLWRSEPGTASHRLTPF